MRSARGPLRGWTAVTSSSAESQDMSCWASETTPRARELHLSKRRTWTDPDVVALMVGLCVGVRERVDRLPLEMARRREPAGFRDATRGPAMSSDAEAQARAELEAVEDVRRTRRQSASANVGLVVLGVVVLGVLLEWIAHR
jgi:hypothetical protein